MNGLCQFIIALFLYAINSYCGLYVWCVKFAFVGRILNTFEVITDLKRSLIPSTWDSVFLYASINYSRKSHHLKKKKSHCPNCSVNNGRSTIHVQLQRHLIFMLIVAIVADDINEHKYG